MTEVPDNIPTVNAVEFAAEMAKSWKLQTDRLIQAILLISVLGVSVVTSVNWGVQYRLSRAAQILDSTRQSVAQNRDMIDGLKEERLNSEARFRSIMAAVKSVELAVDQRYGGRRSPLTVR